MALAGLGWSALFVFFYLFPDGRFLPRWTSLAAAGWAAFTALSYVCPPSWPIHQAASANGVITTGPLYSVRVLSFFASVVVAQIYRYRRVSTAAQRQQTKWVVCGFIVGFAGLGANVLVVGPFINSIMAQVAGLFGFYAVLLLIPLSIAVSILRYQLWDIDLLINRALVYGTLTACVIGLYVLVVGYLGTVFRTSGNLAISLVSTALVAVLFQPLRQRLQRGVNRLMYGERDDPYAVLSRLGRRLESTLAPDAVLPVVVQTVTEALRLPYAAIALREEQTFRIAAMAGTPSRDVLRLPLVYQHEIVGELLLAPRSPGENFGPADRRLLEDLARQAGIAAHAVRLTADLQRSRERLVTGREEERRRLRRDLHDGLGPTLASLTLKLGAVRKLMYHDLSAADAVLADLKAQTQAAIVDIRHLVYALRPPALDELGLALALREAASQYDCTGPLGQGPQVSVEIPELLPPLPAAVEVAIYRIAHEALTNVVRHAEARHCQIRLTLAEETGLAYLEIHDDGRGLSLDHRVGVGLASMRERAEELGGVCAIEPMPKGGTVVRVRVPFGTSPAALEGEAAVLATRTSGG